MNSELKQKWITALRSGDYLQGRGQLKICGNDANPNYFCCLGVLADIIDPDGWDGYLWGDSAENISIQVRREINLSHEHTQTLIAMNDSGKCTFEYIADHIEKGL